MQINEGIYSDDFALNSYDVDHNNLAHTAYYFRIMQEVAGSHAYHRGVSILHLQQEEKTWVVTRTNMKILRYAHWPNTIHVETWPQQPWKLYYPRVCRAQDTDGNMLFESLSHWVVMDTQKNRPMKPQTISKRFDHVPENIYKDPNLGRRANFETDSFEHILFHTPKVLYSDTDFNRHVNNVIYLEWMLESLPFSFRDSYHITEVDISYRAQTYREDTITVHTGLLSADMLTQQQPIIYHEVLRLLPDGEQETVAVATTTWSLHSQ